MAPRHFIPPPDEADLARIRRKLEFGLDVILAEEAKMEAQIGAQ